MKHLAIRLPLVTGFLLALGSCGQIESGSSLFERYPNSGSSSWQDKSLVDRVFAQSPSSIRINARTNYLTFLESGIPIAKWKVATARPGYATPKGIFTVHTKDVCPPWNNGRGLSAGPCASNNPLGKKALWFHQGFAYGIHGVDWGNVHSVTASNPRARDQSSGCVRNHPDNIEWLYTRVQVGTPVVVGLWDNDPRVVDCSGNAALCSSGLGGDAASGLLPRSFPTWCGMNLQEGFANVRADANTSSAVVGHLEADHKVRVNLEKAGQSISGSRTWYQVEYTLGGKKTIGYLHSSLIDCR